MSFGNPKVGCEKCPLAPSRIISHQAVFGGVECLYLGGFVPLLEMVKKRPILFRHHRHPLGVAGDDEHPQLGRVQVHISRVEQTP